MDLIKKIRKFVAENQPVAGKVARIGGRERKFVCGEVGFKETIEALRPDSSTMDGFIFLDAKLEFSDQPKRLKIVGKKELQNVVFLGNTEFSGISFVEGFTLLIEAADNASIIFKNCIFNSKIKIRSKETGDYEREQENKIALKELKFIDCYMLEGEGSGPPYIRVGFLKVENFKLSNLRVPNNAEINIGDCDFENFQLSNFRNSGKFKIYKINVEKNKKKGIGNFQIDNTSIGDADFQSIDLASFATRTIFDNILSGVQYTNVRWERPKGDDIEVGQCPEGGNLEREKKRDTYRVLKNVAQNNNDMPQAFKFYAKEMKYHWKLINKNKHWYDKEKIILWFNRWTNNFGQDWRLPVVWILFGGWASYAGLLFAFNGQYNPELWSKFFVFLNPTHRTTFIADIYWNGCAYAIDFFFRIFEGSLIYQGIQAFRRFSRKI